jgi:uncharacterized protein YraI
MVQREFFRIAFTSVFLCVASAAFAKPGYVASTVNLRATPSTTASVVTKIPAGSLIEASDCADGWCAVTFQDQKGFAIQSALDLSGRVPQRRAAAPRRAPGPVYEDDDYVVVEPPVVYAPPPGYYGYRPYWRPHWGWHRW